MAVSLDHCKEMEGRIVDLRIGRAYPEDRPAFRCRLVAVEIKNGEEMIYVEPADHSGIGLALPLRHVQDLTLSGHSAALVRV